MKQFNPLDHAIALQEPLRIAPSGWLMHVPFAMALVEILKPKVLVELGTHHGVSYAAFCQAVKALGLPARCYAIDTWRGDSQAGFYGEDVYDNFKAHHDPLYSEFSTLMRTTFDEASATFEAGAIDLLHIDGYHTYDEVRHDFETWISKVSARGVVLLHDTHLKHDDFGVWRLWDELRVRYPSFDIPYGNGLGILATGTEIPQGLRTLIELPDDEKREVIRYFEKLGQTVAQAQELTVLARETEYAIQQNQQDQQRHHEQDLQRVIEQYEWLLHQQQAEQAALQQRINERAHETEHLQVMADFLANHTQQLEQQLNMMTSTRAWKTAQVWYRLKQGQLPESITGRRVNELTATARNIIRNEGLGAFAKRMYLWGVKGERRFYRKSLVPPAERTGKANSIESPAPASASPATPAPVVIASYGRSLSPDLLQQFTDVFRQAIAGDAKYVSVLNWDTGMDLAAAFPDQAVFSPPTSTPPLAYLDSSVDVVAVPSGNPDKLADATRIAERAVIVIGTDDQLTVNWKARATTAAPVRLPSVSLVLPTYNHLDYTENCLRQMVATIPATMDVEIIVVDDCSPTPGVYEAVKAWESRDPRIQVFRNPENMGYLMTCKLGAERATKDIVVTLNNDILPHPGWIEALAETFVVFPDAGVVGGLLLYPDGRLQEAGAAIFNDANAWNIGRLEDPDSPQYNYVRKADYVSGALMATPRSLWNEIGGYDERFRPLYYEDSDYCLEVKARGYAVYVQPKCRITHFEGVTSGTDPSKKDSPKHYQKLNAAKFQEKWQSMLLTHPAPPDNVSPEAMLRLALVGSRLDARRVLICAPVLPEFDRESGSRRFLHFIDMFQKLGWEVSLLIQNPINGQRYISMLQQRGVAVFSGDPHFNYPEILLRAGQFDLVLTIFWEFAEFFNRHVRLNLPAAQLAVDTIDLHFIRYARDGFLNNPDDGLDLSYGERFTRELNAYHASDAVITVSDKEAQWVNDFLTDKRNAYCVPDSEYLDRSPVPFKERRGMLFMGNFRHPPNVQAYYHLINEIVPRLDPALLEKHPIYVVGNDMERFLGRPLKNAIPNVHMVGWVPSVVPYLEQAAISIIPLLVGAGTKRKLLQSLMVGTPGVSTSIGVEGMGLVHENQVLIADDPDTFVEEISRLLTDEALWTQLADTGRDHALKHYSKDVVEARFSHMLKKLGLN